MKLIFAIILMIYLFERGKSRVKELDERKRELSSNYDPFLDPDNNSFESPFCHEPVFENNIEYASAYYT
eukprot:UN16644